MAGKFIVIEGSDGSGKATQFRLLNEHLESTGQTTISFDFPRYGEKSAYFVERYLNGKYGSSTEVGPYQSSLFFAMDRFEASFELRQALKDGEMVLSNRYVGSNMAHQGGKITDPKERGDFFRWVSQTEFEILGIPKPDLNIVLLMPPAIAYKLIDQKTNRSYIEKGNRDLHEQDLDHLTRANETYVQMCQTFPDTFVPVDSAPEGKLRSIESIASEVWALVQNLE